MSECVRVRVFVGVIVCVCVRACARVRSCMNKCLLVRGEGRGVSSRADKDLFICHAPCLNHPFPTDSSQNITNPQILERIPSLLPRPSSSLATSQLPTKTDLQPENESKKKQQAQGRSKRREAEAKGSRPLERTTTWSGGYLKGSPPGSVARPARIASTGGLSGGASEGSPGGPGAVGAPPGKLPPGPPALHPGATVS